LQCSLSRFFAKTHTEQAKAEKKARRICRGVTLLFACGFLLCFFLFCLRKQVNLSLLAFGLFLFVGAFGNKEQAVYEKLDFSFTPSLQKGVELRRVAILNECPIKDAFRFLARGSYLVLEVYDKQERHLFNLSQNRLAALFAAAQTPYEKIGELYERVKF